MRFIAISVVVMAGAVMAAAGTLAEAMPDARRYSDVDEWGLAVIAGGLLLLVRELWHARQERVADAAGRRKERIVDATVGIGEATRHVG
jgi:hypothetical protein